MLKATCHIIISARFIGLLFIQLSDLFITYAYTYVHIRTNVLIASLLKLTIYIHVYGDVSILLSLSYVRTGPYPTSLLTSSPIVTQNFVYSEQGKLSLETL